MSALGVKYVFVWMSLFAFKISYGIGIVLVYPVVYKQKLIADDDHC